MPAFAARARRRLEITVGACGHCAACMAAGDYREGDKTLVACSEFEGEKKSPVG